MTLLSLGAIVEASDTITELLAGHCRESFAGDRSVRAAVLGQIATIGAAAAQLPESFRAAHPEVPWAELATWRALRGTRGDAADWPAVWRAAAQRLPELGETLAGLLAAEKTGVHDQ
ncbi:MAG TPA: HepT-like ribonuclease domain-containing protein [Thermoanaerobaculaceae bacterium]|nr:HepT-like ribonuclease domain-containing protein [Thermoanaerobaculaceae bacterium]